MNTRAVRRQFVSRWLSKALLLLLLLLLAVVVYSYLLAKKTRDQVAKQVVLVDAAIAAVIDDEAIKQSLPINVDASLNKPLWMVTRLPFQIEEIPEPEPEPTAEEPEFVAKPLEGVTLSSVMIVGAHRVILLNSKDGVLRMEPGMRYQDWELTEIGNDFASFSAGSEKTRLELRPFAQKPTAPVRTLGGKKK